MSGAALRLPLLLLSLLLFSLASSAPSQVGPRVNLQESRVSGGYRLVLEKSLNQLRQFLAAHHWSPLEELARDLPQFNDALVAHVQFLYEEKNSVASGRNAILAVQH